MDDGTLLLSALHARPADALAWLAFADWLEESDSPGPAELTRLLTHLRQDRAPSPQVTQRERRVRELLAAGVLPVGPSVTNSLGMTFALIPPGAFRMGSPADEDGRFSDETPLHSVTLTRAYYLGIHPVTQAQYRAVVGSNPSSFALGGEDGGLVAGEDTSAFPVDSVTWDAAVGFCNRLGSRLAERRAKHSYRLPSEAEWEYACRGGLPTPAPFSFGQSLRPDQARHDFSESQRRQGRSAGVVYRPCPAPVGSHPPNAYGLYDMHGNVWEYCNDWFEADYYAEGPAVDPPGPSEGDSRVLRGGSWYSQPTVCRSACRNPVAMANTSGFRVVLVAG